jgi:hypothetical protein
MSNESSKDELYARCVFFLNKGRLAQAEQALADYLKNFESDGIGWSLLAYLHGSMNRKPEMEKALQKAKDFADENADVWYNIGIAYLRVKESVKASDALKKSQKLNKELKQKIKGAWKEDFPRPIIPIPNQLSGHLESLESEIASGPKISSKPPVDREVNVISGMFRTLRGVIQKHNVRNKSGWFMGDVVIKLENEYVRMRYGPSSDLSVPEIGSTVTVEFEDGLVPKILEISTDTTKQVTSLAYTPVPDKPTEARWPKVCCGCGEHEIGQLKTFRRTWNHKIKVDRPKDVKQATDLFSLGVDAAISIARAALRVAIPYPVPILNVAPSGVPKAGEKALMISGIHMSLRVVSYLCESCRYDKKSTKSQIHIEALPLGEGFPLLAFEFENERYQNAFENYNPYMVPAKYRMIG